MRFVLVFCFLLLSGPAFAQMPYEWKTCETDSDCRIVGGGCFLDAVNQAHITQGTQYANDINARVECVRYIDPLKARAECYKPPKPCPPEAMCPEQAPQCRAVE